MQELSDDITEILSAEMINKIKENENIFDEYNCFGFVSAYFGWNNTITYEDEETIINYLNKNTIEINNIYDADIVAWYENDEIIHIGIIVSARNETYIAKMGGLELAIDDINCGVYDYAGKIKYYKIN